MVLAQSPARGVVVSMTLLSSLVGIVDDERFSPLSLPAERRSSLSDDAIARLRSRET
jgi:hypothetical protein